MNEPPVLRVVAGGMPTDEETAALTAVLTAVASGASGASGSDHDSRSRSRWRDSGAPAAPDGGWLDTARWAALRRPQ